MSIKLSRFSTDAQAARLIVFSAALLASASVSMAQESIEELPPARSTKPSAAARSPGVTEVVRERHSDGRVSVERHVTLDASQNFVNHGAYASFDEAGAKLRSGQYNMGQRTGLWTQWHRGHDAKLLQEPPYSLFRPPFASQASFRDGKLHGSWVIFDSRQQKVSEINFVQGSRSGPAIWWYPSGGKMRELAFVDDALQGTATFYRANGQVARREKYEQGHRIEALVQKYPEGRKFCEGTFRHPKIVMTEPDDWELMQYATFQQDGKGTKEGEWIVYYPNGQRQMVGLYRRDKPVGAFTWWHETGQRASTGLFKEGSKAGQWTWWHANGMKMSQGEFRGDTPHGMWASWDAEGALIQQIDALQDAEAIASAPATGNLPSPVTSDENEGLESIEPGGTFVNEKTGEDLRKYFLPTQLNTSER